MFKFKQGLAGLGVASLLAVASMADAATMPIKVEGFDGPSLPVDWLVINNSTPNGSTSWFSGNLGVFGPQAGASYAAANFNAAPAGGAISDWFLSPVVALGNGYTVSFYLRDDDVTDYSDAMQVRLSTNGASTNVGTTTTSLGDFTTLLLNVSTVSRIPLTDSWTQYTATITGLSSATSGRIGFRYTVPNSNNADYIGLDSFVVTAIPEPESTLLLALGLTAMVVGLRRKSRG